jgi:uncharacterized surface protein with fasciclin (FAS1) repeats
MKTQIALLVATALFGCNQEAPSGGAQQPDKAASAAPAVAEQAPKPIEAALAPDDPTVAGVASRSPDHTTLVAALKAADLVGVLASPGGAYTVFAPTNAAFDKLPKGTVEGLLKPEKKADLRAILQHHGGALTRLHRHQRG